MASYQFFDATFYLNTNADVAADWSGEPLDHYLQFGFSEERAPTAWFDAQYYRATNPDLQNMNGAELFAHYNQYGFAEGRVPSGDFENFDAARYLADYPDLEAGGVTMTTALAHFLVYGISEQRLGFYEDGSLITAGNPVTGDTLLLTTGFDTLVGTAGNDTFVATDGTITVGDSVNGGGGVGDTLRAVVDTDSSVDLSKIALSNVEALLVQASSSLTHVDVNNYGFNSITLQGMANSVDVENVRATSAVSVQGSKNDWSDTDVYASDDTSTTVNINNTFQGTGPLSENAYVQFNNDLTLATTVTANLSALNMNADSNGYSWVEQYITPAAPNAAITSNVLISGATSDGSDYSGVEIYVEQDGSAAVTLNATIENSDSVYFGAYADYDGNGTVAPTNVANITLNNLNNSSGDSEVDLEDFATINVTVEGASTLDWFGTYSYSGTKDYTFQTVNIVANADLTLDELNVADYASSAVVISGSGNVDLGDFDGNYDTTGLTDGSKTSTIDASALTGNLTVNAQDKITSFTGGSGNDTLTLADALQAGQIMDGGAGIDKLSFDNITGTLIAQDYALINGVVQNFEKLAFQNAVVLDASKLTGNYSEFTFDQSSTVTKVTDEALIAKASLTAVASGYDNTTTPHTYAGALDITAMGNGSSITAAADSAAVNVKAGTGDVSVVVGGDLKSSLTINTTNGATTSDPTTADDTYTAASFSVVTGVNLGALASTTLTGNGTVTIDNSNGGVATKLATVDSSLGGTEAYGANKGDITGGLNYTANTLVTESITVGSGTDSLSDNDSSYGKLDTITGFDAVKETDDATSTTDTLVFAGLTLDGTTANAGIEEITIDTGIYTTLALAFTYAAEQSAADGLVVQFAYQGNTYLLSDATGTDAGLLDNADLAIKLVGSVDLTTDFAVFA